MIGRRKPTRRRNKYVFNFYSNKNFCHIWCESVLESNYALSLEFDSSVTSYCSQPEHFDVYGKRYTPDFLVQYKSGLCEYIEVKHTCYMDEFFFRKHTLRQECVYALTKCTLKLISEKDIHVVAVNNLRMLKRYLDISVIHLLEKVGSRKTITFEHLKNAVKKIHNATPVDAWALVAQQYFLFDITKPLNDDVTLQRNY